MVGPLWERSLRDHYADHLPDRSGTTRASQVIRKNMDWRIVLRGRAGPVRPPTGHPNRVMSIILHFRPANIRKTTYFSATDSDVSVYVVSSLRCCYDVARLL